jgi:hypothetical protein
LNCFILNCFNSNCSKSRMNKILAYGHFQNTKIISNVSISYSTSFLIIRN